ncbi:MULTISPECIES: hypothetical protein [Kamptonema]|uniref:hypothetical protein n=1 Tax=Kamptonema TaxID=1501433 RepID=UPI0002DF087C|nr:MULTISPECIES: hypothetical protein [Kamptonema]
MTLLVSLGRKNKTVLKAGDRQISHLTMPIIPKRKGRDQFYGELKKPTMIAVTPTDRPSPLPETISTLCKWHGITATRTTIT